MSRTAGARARRRAGDAKRDRLARSDLAGDDDRVARDEKDVILRGGGLDEAPHAYRRLPDVLRRRATTIEVCTRSRPIVVVMAGADEFDPYKD